jgi:hypothetical protein
MSDGKGIVIKPGVSGVGVAVTHTYNADKFGNCYICGKPWGTSTTHTCVIDSNSAPMYYSAESYNALQSQLQQTREELRQVSELQSIAANNCEKLITELEQVKAERDLQNKEIERLRNYLETLRSNTPYGMYQRQITEVLQDAGEWPCTCGNCDGEHFGMAIKREG